MESHNKHTPNKEPANDNFEKPSENSLVEILKRKDGTDCIMYAASFYEQSVSEYIFNMCVENGYSEEEASAVVSSYTEHKLVPNWLRSEAEYLETK